MARCMKCMMDYASNLKACPHCGTLIDAKALKPYHLQTKTILNERYTVGMYVSENSITIKYNGYDNLDRCRVIIYEYFPTSLAVRNNSGMLTFRNEHNEELFAKGLNAYVEDIQKLAAISDSPGIEAIKEFFIENSTCYVVCEWEPYVLLSDYLKDKNKEKVINPRLIAKQLIRILELLDRKGIVHGNISPDHIIITKSSQVKLVDFGIASYVNSTGISVYNPSYSPIEAYGESAEIMSNSDIYSVAAVCYKVFTEITPYTAEKRRAGKEIIPMRKLGIDVDKNFDDIILKAMSIDPENRYSSVKEFSHALRECRSTNKRRIRNSDIKWMFIFLGVLIFILICIVSVIIAKEGIGKNTNNTIITSETVSTTTEFTTEATTSVVTSEATTVQYTTVSKDEVKTETSTESRKETSSNKSAAAPKNTAPAANGNKKSTAAPQKGAATNKTEKGTAPSGQVTNDKNTQKQTEAVQQQTQQTVPDSVKPANPGAEGKDKENNASEDSQNDEYIPMVDVTDTSDKTENAGKTQKTEEQNT